MSFVRSLAKLRTKSQDQHPEWLIVGLGNPGAQYARTRHNIGFMVLNRLAHRAGVRFRSSTADRSDVAPAMVAGVPVLLAQPQTYMNESGIAVARMVKRLQLSADRVVLIYDDVDLPFATIRVRQSGSDGGHRGVRSIVQSLGTNEVPRIRMGVGRGAKDTKDYVLSEFLPDERQQVPQLCDNAIKIVESITTDGIISAMNSFNGKASPETAAV